MVVAVDFERWNQTVEDLRTLALTATHCRTRERFLALYDVACGTNVSQLATQCGRSDDSLFRWLHAYNERGPDALVFRHTGGRPPFPPPLPTRSSKKSVQPSKPPRRRP